MAWRIHESVIRGELDNRERGRVTGQIWLAGRPEPLVLDLQGNCARDLAGRRLEFVNPHPVEAEWRGLVPRQVGVTGDITASRKVRVPDVPKAELMRCLEERRPFPTHWANSLYLEWFSEYNGRVVIESADFALTVIGEAAWEATPAEEEEQHRRNAAAMSAFMGSLAEAVEQWREENLGPNETEPEDQDDRPR
jgi:hypothetical protein